jgi:hypothetical protein
MKPDSSEWYHYFLTRSLPQSEAGSAAYAWCLMEGFFAETWTTWLLFCDLRRVYRYASTYQRAQRLVLEVHGRFAAAAAPVFNSYCSRCANAGECPALINRADQALALAEKPRFDFQAVLASPQRLGAFFTARRGVEPYQQQASDRAKQFLEQKVEVPDWSLVTRSPRKYVEPPALRPFVDRLGCSRNMATCRRPNIKRLCAEVGIKPDSAAIKQGAGAIYLRATPELTAERR